MGSSIDVISMPLAAFLIYSVYKAVTYREGIAGRLMDHQGHYWCTGTSRSYYSLPIGCKHAAGATNCFLLTRMRLH